MDSFSPLSLSTGTFLNFLWGRLWKFGGLLPPRGLCLVVYVMKVKSNVVVIFDCFTFNSYFLYDVT